MPTGTNAVIKERLSATRSAFSAMTKMDSDPDISIEFEKLATLWEDF